jgi:hypothetical protein
MNIFIVDADPIIAARMLCDKHIVKMPLETAQILCTCSNTFNIKAPYKSTHINHPVVKWTMASYNNWMWLVQHGISLCDEYSSRYFKIHKCKKVILACMLFGGKPNNIGKTEHPLCMPDDVKIIGDPVQSYRKYYMQYKADIAKWKMPHTKPEWFAK